MTSDPTPAEIEAGAQALVRQAGEHPVLTWETIVTIVLRAVLPDHDARVRAEVAEAIARDIETGPGPVDEAGRHPHAVRERKIAAAIARSHTTGGHHD